MNTASAPDPSLAAAWRLNPSVRWRLWQGEAVAYNGRTGDTHHFADFAGWAFAQLCDGPAKGDDLAREAADTIDLSAGGDLASVLRRTLALFLRLELIEAAAC